MKKFHMLVLFILTSLVFLHISEYAIVDSISYEWQQAGITSGDDVCQFELMV